MKISRYDWFCSSYFTFFPFQEENSDLFYSIPWSHGTLGFLVAAELRIIPAKKYVKVTYKPACTFDAVVDTFSKASADKENDYVEGLMYSYNEAVVMCGKMTDTCEDDKVRISVKFWILKRHTIQSCAVMTRSNITSEFKLTKDTPYLPVTGKLWSVYCDDFGEILRCYNGTALYQASIDWMLCYQKMCDDPSCLKDIP